MPIDPLSPPPEPPSPPRKMHRLPRAGLSVGVAAGLAFGGAGIAFAASSATSTSHASSSPSTTMVPRPAPGQKGGKVHGPRDPFARGLGMGLRGVVHGEVTVPNGSGGYRTIELQVGKVTSVNSSSITVTSADGYQHTYAVVPSTVIDAQTGGISSVAGGDQVHLVAGTRNGKDTAMDIQDTTKVGNSRKAFGFAPGKASGIQGQPTAPQASGA